MKLIRFLCFVCMFVILCLVVISYLVDSTKLFSVAMIIFIIEVIVGAEVDSRANQKEWEKQHPVKVPDEFKIRNLLREKDKDK